MEYVMTCPIYNQLQDQCYNTTMLLNQHILMEIFNYKTKEMS